MNKFETNELIPVIIQDELSGEVRMLGYMNLEAFEKTLADGKVCFFSRSKNRLWVKGESSGNFLFWSEYFWDCDEDTLIFKVNAVGPTCHNGTLTCFGENYQANLLGKIETTIADRRSNHSEKSYVSSLTQKGMNKVAQKVGEEAVEMVIEALGNNDELFLEESADLLFHYLILLQQKGFVLNDVLKVLQSRQKPS
jgi:phosphoribosyl-AMP cyclohydrolase / phosphoribosyl-ATP pyrophosphohydrolase